MPNVLFLDIDGVLNSHQWFEKRIKSHGDEDDTRRQHDLSMLCPDLVGYLNDFLNECPCKVILSSTWRRNTHIDEMTELLKLKGFDHKIEGATPIHNDRWSLRGNEIREWIRTHVDNDAEFNRYVIFDDDSDMLLWQKDNFFKIDSFTGLTPSICWRAKHFLNRTK